MEHVITGYTRLIGLLGYPIKHSKSPRMQNLSFAKMGADLVYLTFDVDEKNLADAIKAMRVLNAAGCQITMPNKAAILPLLDELSEEARLIGSVNTVKNIDGKFKGFNTDGMGFVSNLDDHGVEYKGKKIVMCGAGGAGRAVAVQLALSGVKELTIFDAVEKSAKDVAAIINDNIKTCVAAAYLFDEDHLSREMKTAAIYADCTPFGMAPFEDKAVVSSADKLPENIIVVDICHTPPRTKLLAMAESRGLKTINGIGMMYNQGAKAFNIWTGLNMPVDYVKEQMGLSA